MISHFVANSEKCRRYTFLGGSAQIIRILHRGGYQNLLQYDMGGGIPDLLQYYKLNKLCLRDLTCPNKVKCSSLIFLVRRHHRVLVIQFDPG